MPFFYFPRFVFSVFTLVLFGVSFFFPVSVRAYFSDVYSTEPVNVALDFLLTEGIVEGYSDGTFRPLNLINRAEFTKMIIEGILGETPDSTVYKKCFSDVQEDWYAKYVCRAQELGWVQGYEGGEFRPADSITYTEAIKILAESLEWELSKESYSTFLDVVPGDWFEPYVLMAEERGLLDQLDYYLSPHELISRRQMAELLYRALMYEEGSDFSVWTLEDTDRSYQEVLATGITAAYPTDMNFTHYSQSGWPYGCYSFATKNLLEFKYDYVIDISEVQETIGWDGRFIWSPEEFLAFASSYNVDVIFTYDGSAEFFFKQLARGEPMILYIPYYLGDVNIGHQLVAYSFDNEGVWVADSLSGGVQRQISYEDVFLDGATYTTNLTQLRLVKAGGQHKGQVGL